jgi:hypothetical protein
MKDEYPTGKADLMAAFMLKSQMLTAPGGTWAMINLPSWMSLKSFEDLRHDLLRDQRISSMVHLGRGVFGSDFGSVAFVVANAKDVGGHAVYRRLFEQHVDVRSVVTIEALFRDANYNRFEVSQADFAAIPGTPIVYWLSEKMRAAFKESPALARRSRSAKGLVTADNATYVRFWWEVAQDETGFDNADRKDAQTSRRRWFPYAKGGEFRRWAGNLDSVVDWQDDGRRLQTTMTADGARVRATNFNLDRVFRAGLAWTVVTSGEQSFRRVPRGSLFDAAAGMCQSDTDEIHLAILNSHVVSMILSAINPTLNLHPGYLGAVPVPRNADELSTITVTRLVETSENDWDAAETAWGFQVNPLVALVRTSSTNPDA